MKQKSLCRVCSVLLSILLVVSGALSRPAALNVKAASLGTALALDEASMLLWNLLMNAFIACGVSAAVSDDSTGAALGFGTYDYEAALYEGMVRYYEEEYNAAADADMVFTLQNGSRYTLGDLMEAARWDIVGSEGCYIPDEATWQRFKLSAPADEAAFSSIASFALSADLLEHIAGFAGAVQAGKVEGLNPADYFPAGFDGTLPRDAEGNYIGSIRAVVWNNGRTLTYDYSFTNARPILFYVATDSSFLGYTIRSFDVTSIYALTSGKAQLTGSPSAIELRSYGRVFIYDSANFSPFFYESEANMKVMYNDFAYQLLSFSSDIPVFSTQADAYAYLNAAIAADVAAMDAAAEKAGNRALDYPALADALADSLSPLLVKELAPSLLNVLYPALADALDPALNPDIADTDNPALVLDPAAATDAYKKAVADTVADVAVSAVAVPDVDIETGSYTVNLTNIFPFCLPFDFIRLLNALDAEPVTPSFDFPFVVPVLDMDITLKLDLSMFNDFMEIFRLCEVVSFIVMLIFATPKLIRW